MRGTLFMIHWNDDEAEEYAALLRDAGWHVEIEAEEGDRACRRIKEDQPDAIVIYLLRLPSHGRHTAQHLHSVNATRNIPIIFVGGSEAIVEKTLAAVPSAIFVPAHALLNTLDVVADRITGIE